MNWIKQLICKWRGHNFDWSNTGEVWTCARCSKFVYYSDIAELSMIRYKDSKYANKKLNELYRCGVRK